MNKIFEWSIVLIALLLNYQSLYAHKNHKDKPAMPAIGIVQGSIIDSTSLKLGYLISYLDKAGVFNYFPKTYFDMKLK